MLASVLGASAVGYLLAGQSGAMVGMRKGAVVLVPFRDIIGKKKQLPIPLLGMAQILAS